VLSEVHHFHHPISKANSVCRSLSSDGYCSSNSSEDADQVRGPHGSHVTVVWTCIFFVDISG